MSLQRGSWSIRCFSSDHHSQKGHHLDHKRKEKTNHQIQKRSYTITLYPQSRLLPLRSIGAGVSRVQDVPPTLASPAQRLVVGVVVVGGRHCSSTGGSSSSAAMAETLLLPLLQRLRRYGHLHCLAVATGPAPPLAARRPGSDHAPDACKARLLQEHTTKGSFS